MFVAFVCSSLVAFVCSSLVGLIGYVQMYGCSADLAAGGRKQYILGDRCAVGMQACGSSRSVGSSGSGGAQRTSAKRQANRIRTSDRHKVLPPAPSIFQLTDYMQGTGCGAYATGRVVKLIRLVGSQVWSWTGKVNLALRCRRHPRSHLGWRRYGWCGCGRLSWMHRAPRPPFSPLRQQIRQGQSWQCRC